MPVCQTWSVGRSVPASSNWANWSELKGPRRSLSREMYQTGSLRADTTPSRMCTPLFEDSRCATPSWPASLRDGAQRPFQLPPQALLLQVNQEPTTLPLRLRIVLSGAGNLDAPLLEQSLVRTPVG